MTFSSEEEQIKRFEEDMVVQDYIAVLRALIAKKSIFAQQVGLQEVAAYLKEIFTKAGAEVELDESYTAPFVIATFKSQNPTAKTIIFYNHYDTVPADSDQIWTDDPFTLSIRDGSMYGRGVDDDKGHIIARLTAVQKYLQKHKSLPVNVIFMMEGAEESASVDLEKYLAKHKALLQGADLLIWEQGIKNSLGQLEISGGNKGIVTFDMKVQSAEVDIHSSFGGRPRRPGVHHGRCRGGAGGRGKLRQPPRHGDHRRRDGCLDGQKRRENAGRDPWLRPSCRIKPVDIRL